MDGLSIEEISTVGIKEGLIKAVKKRLKSDNVKICIEHGSKKGDNLMGEIYRILYEDENNKDNEKNSSLILKIAPKATGEFLESRDMFLREIFMYDKVLAYFYDFQVSKGVIPKENGFNECPRCYFSLSEKSSESLFLEDLKRRQFDMSNLEQKLATFEHVSLILQALGKFHAISYALKDQEPQKFKEMSKMLECELFWSTVESKFNRHYVNMMNRLITILEEANRIDLINKFKTASGDDLFVTLRRFITATSSEPYAVICHGDPTINNVMFRNDDNGKPVEIQMFDLQFSRYASPVVDIVLFLFGSTTKELRDAHYEDFLKIYYSSLSDLLTRLGSDPEKIFPYEALLGQFRDFGLYAIYVGAFLLPMLCADPNSMNDVEACMKGDPDDPKYQQAFRVPDESKAAYNKRVIGVFEDMARLGYM